MMTLHLLVLTKISNRVLGFSLYKSLAEFFKKQKGGGESSNKNVSYCLGTVFFVLSAETGCLFFLDDGQSTPMLLVLNGQHCGPLCNQAIPPALDGEAE